MWYTFFSNREMWLPHIYTSEWDNLLPFTPWHSIPLGENQRTSLSFLCYKSDPFFTGNFLSLFSGRTYTDRLGWSIPTPWNPQNHMPIPGFPAFYYKAFNWKKKWMKNNHHHQNKANSRVLIQYLLRENSHLLWMRLFIQDTICYEWPLCPTFLQTNSNFQGQMAASRFPTVVSECIYRSGS